jgi:hypothetical protein
VTRLSERQIVDELIVVAEDLAERAKQLIKEGSAKKLTVKDGDKTILEIPLTAGVFGALVAPYLAALGIFSALLTKCTIAIEEA